MEEVNRTERPRDTRAVHAPGPPFVEKPLLRQISPSVSGGARGGGSPPRVGSNTLNALYDKAFSERSEDFSAAARQESNGILQAVGKVPGLFRQPVSQDSSNIPW